MDSAKFKSVIFGLVTSSNYDEDMIASETPPNDLDCPLCLYLLHRPKTLSRCGHVFCHACIAKWFCKSKNCPLCRATCGLNDISAPSEAITTSLNSLLLKCKFQNCPYTCVIKDLERHHSSCPCNPGNIDKGSPDLSANRNANNAFEATPDGLIFENRSQHVINNDDNTTTTTTTTTTNNNVVISYNNNSTTTTTTNESTTITTTNDYMGDTTITTTNDYMGDTTNDDITITTINEDYLCDTYMFPRNSTHLTSKAAMTIYFKLLKGATLKLFKSNEWRRLKNSLGPFRDISWYKMKDFWQALDFQATSTLTSLNDQLGYIEDDEARIVTSVLVTKRLLRKWERVTKRSCKHLGARLKFYPDYSTGFMHLKGNFWIRETPR